MTSPTIRPSGILCLICNGFYRKVISDIKDKFFIRHLLKLREYEGTKKSERRNEKIRERKRESANKLENESAVMKTREDKIA